jgi:DNA-binding NtrC family response regulator
MDFSVLIVTGSQETRAALSQIFTNQGWAVREGGAKADAAELLKRSPARLIVTDSKLPDGNWLDILALAQSVAPEVQVVVTAPHADDALWAEVLYRGAYDVIAQPLDEREVVRVGQSAVRARGNQWTAAAGRR